MSVSAGFDTTKELYVSSIQKNVIILSIYLFQNNQYEINNIICKPLAGSFSLFLAVDIFLSTTQELHFQEKKYPNFATT